jgi:hypothetical protein
MRTDGQSDRNDESNSRFSNISNAPIKKRTLLHCANFLMTKVVYGIRCKINMVCRNPSVVFIQISLCG